MRDDVAGTFSIDSIGEVKSYDEGKSERTYFTTTFVFPVEKKNQIICYLKKHKNEIVERIIEESEKE